MNYMVQLNPQKFQNLIHETNKIDIKPSMIQPVQEIKSLGKFKVKISLHSAVDAEINNKCSVCRYNSIIIQFHPQ